MSTSSTLAAEPEAPARLDPIKFEVIRNGPLDKAGMNVAPGMIIESIDGQAIPPDGTFTAVSAGEAHTCAIRTGGTLVCCGEDMEKIA